MAYYANWSGLDLNEIPWYVTHISYAFAKINLDGTVMNDDPVDIGNPSGCNADGLYYKFYQLKQSRPHLKVVLSIGGWTYRDQFLPVMSDAVKRANFVKTAMKLMLNYGFNGLDIDWEYPEDRSQGSYYVQVLKEVRAAMNKQKKIDGNSYLITSAIPASAYLLDAFLLNQSRKFVDWFNLMAYDQSVGTKNAVHASPLFSSNLNPSEDVATKVIKYMKSQGVYSSQIVLGAPIYAHQYKVAKSDPKKGLNSPKVTQDDAWLSNKDVFALKQSNNYVEYYDNVAKASWLYNSADGLFVSFDSQRSVIEKVRYINYKNLRGIFFWELSLDYLTDHFDVAILPIAQNAITKLSYNKYKTCSPSSQFCNIKC